MLCAYMSTCIGFGHKLRQFRVLQRQGVHVHRQSEDARQYASCRDVTAISSAVFFILCWGRRKKGDPYITVALHALAAVSIAGHPLSVGWATDLSCRHDGTSQAWWDLTT